eukprot:jgi/Botrbrau1/10184/Bobra.116_1s0001.1
MTTLGLLVLVAASSVPSSQGGVARKLLDVGVPSTAESPLPLIDYSHYHSSSWISSNGDSETEVLTPDSGDKLHTMGAPSQDPEMQIATVQAIGPMAIMQPQPTVRGTTGGRKEAKPSGALHRSWEETGEDVSPLPRTSPNCCG